MKTFLGIMMDNGKTIQLDLNHYVQKLEVLAYYIKYIKKMFHPKKVPISPGVVLKPDDVP